MVDGQSGDLMPNNPEIEINGRKIGVDHPPLVVAEIGINHGGSIETAIQLVHSAYRVGVEIIKHQTHIVEDEMSSAAREVIPGNAKQSIYEIMSRCSLNEEDEYTLKDFTESLGMIFFSAPFSRAAANRLHRMNVPAYKIGSGECNNYPLLKHIAQFRKPVILSTGMNDLESISHATRIFEKENVPIALMHTTNVYPTPPHLVRLGAMTQLANAFPKAVVGLSDHTKSNSACLGAIALGASIVERHYTDTMDRDGPDIVCSMDENACQELIDYSLELFQMRGGTKIPVAEEQVTMNFAFATVCTILPVRGGDTLTMENTWVKRPGIGQIKAKDLSRVIGQKVTRDLPEGCHLKYSDICMANSFK